MSRIVVLGGGESGVGSAILAKVKGFDVFLSDRNQIAYKYVEMLKEWKIPFEDGTHTEELILNADEVIKSPGIPPTVPIIKKIEEKGIKIISEIEFAGRYDRAKKVCITGSNGKTTTTTLIYHLLKAANFNVGLGGNIGKSYALQVATENYDIYVLELSSFQLDNMYDFKADIAIILNISPDHLDRYDYNMENYTKSKFRIIRNMSDKDSFIFCAEDEITINHLNNIVSKARQLPFSQSNKLSEGAFIDNESITVKYNESESHIFLKELSLGGKHNTYNSMAAAIAGKILNIKEDIIRKSLSTFDGVEHRLEYIRTLKGVKYINDSKATNVEAAWYALECQTQPVIWIVGGKDKGNDYSTLFKLVEDKVKYIICLGKDNEKLHKNFSELVPEIKDTNSAQEAVNIAKEVAQEGDVVLLSPACASFDLFKSYEDRGTQFKNAVNSL